MTPQRRQHVKKAGRVALTGYAIRLNFVGNRAARRAMIGSMRNDIHRVGKGIDHVSHTRPALAVGNNRHVVRATLHSTNYVAGHKKSFAAGAAVGTVGVVAYKRHRKKVNTVAKGKGSWKGGKAPAQGGTPQKISRPEGSKGKLTGAMKKGRKTATRKSSK